MAMNKSLITILLVCVGLAASGQLLLKRQSVDSVAVVRPASVAAATAADTFNRTDVNPLDSPMSDGVSTWVSGPGALNPVSIVSSQANGTANTSGAVVASPTFAANQKANITLAASTSTYGSYCRLQSSSGSGYLLFVVNATTLRFYKVVDTGTLAFNAMGADVTVSAMSAGNVLELQCSGTSTTTLEAFIDGVSKGTRTDSSSPYTSGQPGIYLGSSVRINAFSASDL